MSSFKDFLLEQPHFVVDLGIMCPHKHDVDGTDIRYMFDYGFEFLKDKSVSNRIELNFQRKKGRIPVFCRRHNLFFMWDFDKKENSIPKSNEDHKMIEVAKEGILTNAKNKNDKRVQTEISRSTVYV